MAGNRRRPYKEGNGKPPNLSYPTMSTDEIAAMKVGEFADEGAHLWLWTTNQHLEDGFRVMRAWGFKYLAPIHWIKASGQGNWFIHRTQTMLFGYKAKCFFPRDRYKPNILYSKYPTRHSEKPVEALQLVESVSPEPRLELFARENRLGWDAWGKECLSVPLPLEAAHE